MCKKHKSIETDDGGKTVLGNKRNYMNQYTY